VKLWGREDGNALTSIEPLAPINDICVPEGSGMVMVACEHPRMQMYYVPSVGPAPPWASFLEGLTEEMEEQTDKQLYDDYKFVTRDELEDLQLTHLIGSSLLRAYMHGFFMDARLYQRLKTVANPNAYEEYLQQEVEKKIAAKRNDRITVARKLPKVNMQFAKVLLQQPKVKRVLREAEVQENKDQVQDVYANPLADDRFAKIFQDQNFAIDVRAQCLKLFAPSIDFTLFFVLSFFLFGLEGTF